MGSQSASFEQKTSKAEATPASDSATTTDVGASVGVRTDGQPGAVLSDLAEQFQCFLNEKRELTFRLSKALDENATLNQLHIQARAEIVNLQSQLSSRFQTLLATKERLIRDEYERKYQELTVEVKQERIRHNKLLEEMKKQIANCICGAKAR